MYHLLDLGDNGIQVLLVLKTLRIAFVDVLGTGWPGWELNRATAVLPEALRHSVGGLCRHRRLLAKLSFLLSCIPLSPSCRRVALAITSGSHAHMIGLIP